MAYADKGRTSKPSDATRPGGSKFGLIAFAEVDTRLHLFGIPAAGSAASGWERDEKHILDKEHYEYRDGGRWSVGAQDAAATVIDAPVGELSVVELELPEVDRDVPQR